MTDVFAKPVIFISYSHKDEPDKPAPEEVSWLTFVQSFLAPVVKTGLFDIWVDNHLHGSDELDPEIKAHLAVCDIFVLLTSRHSLASTYVVETEIATMRQRSAKGEDVRIFPIILSPIPNAALKQLKDLVLMPKDGQPLSLLSKNDREVAMAMIADEIAVVTEGIVKRKGVVEENASKPRGRVRTNDTLTNYIANPTAKRMVFDITHLPETGYERLVGRQKELERLEGAWVNRDTNILSLVAEGGAGKSALVNEWLKHLRTVNYSGAEGVLGWSFYSQGTKERATSAEEFLNWALAKLNIELTTNSTTAKAEAIAEAMMRNRVLLLLDGVEPLQHGPGPQRGELKDLGLRTLLRHFATAQPEVTHGLVVLTSRLAVKDIARWQVGTAPVINVERLSDEAGAVLLRDNGVWGIDKEMRAASRDFGGHPLALDLLASYLKETQFGDVRRRDHIRAFFADPDNPRHDHARRVMESYEEEWLTKQPVLFAIMRLVGLFDRPASRKCLFAVRKSPPIEGLTDKIVNLENKKWRLAIALLREVRLLLPVDTSAPDTLDAHPLVRDWFGERLKQTNAAAWKAAHGRIYEHLRDTTKEGKLPTVEDFAPLYQAIAHGCRAELHQEVLHEIYFDRICRGTEYYASQMLGATGSNLAAISWFFEQPYERPIEKIVEPDRSWIISQAAFSLRAQGRLSEALSAQRTRVAMLTAGADMRISATAMLNLSDMELLHGEIESAIATAKKGMEYAERSVDPQLRINVGTMLAHAQHAAGQSHSAKRLFVELERNQGRTLFSVQGFRYRDLLHEEQDWMGVIDRAKSGADSSPKDYPLLSKALDDLSIGRAHLARSLDSDYDKRQVSNDVYEARDVLNEAIKQLYMADTRQFVPHFLLARAAFRRCLGDWSGAVRDLDEVEEIAGSAPMRLFLCEMALERARLGFARIEASAPLNGSIEDSPPKPRQPDEPERKRLHDEVTRQLGFAGDYIDKCGYHRRDQQLAELLAVLRGERKFAALPARV